MTQATDIVRQALEFYANKESYMFRPLRENGNSQTDIIGSPIDEDELWRRDDMYQQLKAENERLKNELDFLSGKLRDWKPTPLPSGEE